MKEKSLQVLHISYMLMLCLTCEQIHKAVRTKYVEQFFNWPLPVLSWFPAKSATIAICAI